MRDPTSPATHEAGETSKSSIPGPQRSLSSCPLPGVHDQSNSVKRKPSGDLESPDSKSARNLLWNSFQKGKGNDPGVKDENEREGYQKKVGFRISSQNSIGEPAGHYRFDLVGRTRPQTPPGPSKISQSQKHKTLLDSDVKPRIIDLSRSPIEELIPCGPNSQLLEEAEEEDDLQQAFLAQRSEAAIPLPKHRQAEDTPTFMEMAKACQAIILQPEQAYFTMKTSKLKSPAKRTSNVNTAPLKQIQFPPSINVRACLPEEVSAPKGSNVNNRAISNSAKDIDGDVLMEPKPYQINCASASFGRNKNSLDPAQSHATSSNTNVPLHEVLRGAGNLGRYSGFGSTLGPRYSAYELQKGLNDPNTTKQHPTSFETNKEQKTTITVPANQSPGNSAWPFINMAERANYLARERMGLPNPILDLGTRCVAETQESGRVGLTGQHPANVKPSKRQKARTTVPADQAPGNSARPFIDPNLLARERMGLPNPIVDLGTRCVAEAEESGPVGLIGVKEAATLIQNSKAGARRNRNSAQKKPTTASNKTVTGQPAETGSSHHSSSNPICEGALKTTGEGSITAANDPESLTNEDWALLALRNRGLGWTEISSRWLRMTGTKHSPAVIKRRIMRLQVPNQYPVPNNVITETQPQTTNKTQQLISEIHQQKRDCGDEARLIPVENVVTKTQDKESRETRVENEDAKQRSLPSIEPSVGHSKVGGKSITEELARYHLDSQENEQDDLCESDDDEESETVHSGSPEAPDDTVHYEYQVKRRTKLADQPGDECEWQVYGEAVSSITEANNAAIAEAKVIRGDVDVSPITKWIMDISETTGLINYFGTGENGTIEIMVDRVLRTFHEGIVPQSKAGWLKRQVFDVVVTTTKHNETIEWVEDEVEDLEQDTEDGVDGAVKHPMDSQGATTLSSIDPSNPVCLGDEIDSLFEESLSDGNANFPSLPPYGIIRKISRTKVIKHVKHVTERTVGGLCAVRDRANRVAGAELAKLEKKFDPTSWKVRQSLDYFYADRRAQYELRERLDELEENDESFDEEVRIPNSNGESTQEDAQLKKITVRVRVVERTLENPRNF